MGVNSTPLSFRVVSTGSFDVDSTASDVAVRLLFRIALISLKIPEALEEVA